MIFYNETGEKIDYHLLKRIGGGSYSRVYMLPNDSCIKVFKEIDNGIAVSYTHLTLPTT